MAKQKNYNNYVEISQKKKARKYPFRTFELMSESLRREITDSLLLSEETTVAEGVTVDGMFFSITVEGDLRVRFQGQVYKDVCQFPEELSKLIKDRKHKNNPDVIVEENNWYQLNIYAKNGDLLYGDLFDIDISTTSEDELKELVLDEIDVIREQY